MHAHMQMGRVSTHSILGANIVVRSITPLTIQTHRVLLRERVLALSMATHTRLGDKCPPALQVREIARMIADMIPLM